MTNPEQHKDLLHYTVTEIETALSNLRFQISVLDTVDEEIMAYKVKQSLQAFSGPLFELQLLKENLVFLTTPTIHTLQTPYLADLVREAQLPLTPLFDKKGLIIEHKNIEFFQKRTRFTPTLGILFFQNILHYLYKVCMQSDKIIFEWNQTPTHYELTIHIPLERLPIKKSLYFELKTAKKILDSEKGKLSPQNKNKPSTLTYLFRCA